MLQQLNGMHVVVQGMNKVAATADNSAWQQSACRCCCIVTAADNQLYDDVQQSGGECIEHLRQQHVGQYGQH